MCTTPHYPGLVNKCKPDKFDDLTMVNGQKEEARKSGDINGNMCHKHDKDIVAGILSKVTWSPTIMFNLMSTPKMLKIYWTIV